jgi:hypothetical protein
MPPAGGSRSASTPATSTSSWVRLRAPHQCRSGCSSTADPPGDACGIDVDEEGNGTLSQQRLYQLIRQRGAITDRTLEISFLAAGGGAYVFTFG